VLSGSSSSLHRIMSLDNPTAKMSKSDASPHASIFLDDSDDRCPTIYLGCSRFDAGLMFRCTNALTLVVTCSIAAKIKRAVTDSTPGISFDPESRPAVSNLVSILASATDREPHDVQRRHSPVPCRVCDRPPNRWPTVCRAKLTRNSSVRPQMLSSLLFGPSARK
jgi:hypothetical protein